MVRKNLGKGKGKGYRNLMTNDSKVHSDSAKGIKQTKSGTKKILTRIKGLTSKGVKRFQEARAKQEEMRKQQRFELLKDVKHPLKSKLSKQKDRVATLEKHYRESETEELMQKLKSEREELRQIQEEITNIKLQDLSDGELRTLAVHYTDDSFFSFGESNPYKKELLRRVDFRKKLVDDIAKAKKGVKEPSILDDLF